NGSDCNAERPDVEESGMADANRRFTHGGLDALECHSVSDAEVGNADFSALGSNAGSVRTGAVSKPRSGSQFTVVESRRAESAGHASGEPQPAGLGVQESSGDLAGVLPELRPGGIDGVAVIKFHSQRSRKT